MEDFNAIMRLKRGDMNGLESLVKKYQQDAIYAAYLMLQDQALAEDIVQTTFLRIYQRIEYFDENRPFKPYLLKSVTNEAIQYLRRSNRFISLEDEVGGQPLAEILPADEPYPEDETEQAELREAVKSALQKLPLEQQATVILTYFHDLTVKEVAEATEVTAGTVKWRLHTARKQLGVLLRQFWTGGFLL